MNEKFGRCCFWLLSSNQNNYNVFFVFFFWFCFVFCFFFFSFPFFVCFLMHVGRRSKQTNKNEKRNDAVSQTLFRANFFGCCGVTFVEPRGEDGSSSNNNNSLSINVRQVRKGMMKMYRPVVMNLTCQKVMKVPEEFNVHPHEIKKKNHA
ncbi:Uncharacterized protein APZ42_024480 [Daphnia magna]|uniref:Transmembrane protein n=1 Tax=Daphnia magna TaxID=35525 RepID=A0A164U0I6_9CRUS|nr:Uncharacterized protein APZ42_024480 [Daphnia magna]